MAKPRLIIAGSTDNADMYYATGILIPDDFIYLEIEDRRLIYVSDLEFSRALEESNVDEVFNLSARPAKYADTLSWIIKENKIKELIVPEDFPIKYAAKLQKLRVKIEIKQGTFFETRSVKQAEEIDSIRKTQKVNENAMRAAIDVLRKSEIRPDRKLSFMGKIITSEFLKEFIEIEFVRGGCKSEDDIVSCGLDTSQPHNSGRGPLFANQPIVIDIYPRSFQTRYFADMTRTVVKGKATPEIKKMHATVLAGQELAIKSIKDGVSISSLFDKVNGYFISCGYKTMHGSRSPEGFIHNLGHGLGLEIHEEPFLGPSNESRLETGNIITIEPGLYYPGIGGVRIEDMVYVQERGCENLTKMSKRLEI